MLIQTMCEYIKEQGVVSVMQLHLKFGVEQSHLQHILDGWVKRGKVELVQPGGCRSSCASKCNSCVATALTLCRWCQ